MHETFRRTYRVRFADCDLAGIVFHPMAFSMTNALTEDWFREALGRPFETMNEAGYLFPVVHIECDFLKPMKTGEVIEKALEVERIGTSSVSVAIVFSRDGETTFACRETMVCVDMATRKAMPVPGDLRAKMLAYARR